VQNEARSLFVRHLQVVTRSRSFPILFLAMAVVALLGAGHVEAQPPARANRLEHRQYAQEILMAAMGHLGGLQRCQAQSTADPEVMGQRIRTISIVIRPDGRISEVSASPRNLVPATLRSCVLAIARQWPLTPPRGGARPLRLHYTRSQIQALLGGP
jgi:hypothetical protein